MEVAWKMNQFSSNPGGITLNDFLKKAEYDVRLMRHYNNTHCE